MLLPGASVSRKHIAAHKRHYTVFSVVLHCLNVVKGKSCHISPITSSASAGDTGIYSVLSTEQGDEVGWQGGGRGDFPGQIDLNGRLRQFDQAVFQLIIAFVMQPC